MENNEIRKCEICGRSLCTYNRSKVCYSHSSHPEYDEEEINKRCSKFRCDCSSRTPRGRIEADIDYFGDMKDWLGNGNIMKDIEFPKRDLCNLFR